MKNGKFNVFLSHVNIAGLTDNIWNSPLWEELTERQALDIAQDLDRNPLVKKLERNGEKVYIFPNGREWKP